MTGKAPELAMGYTGSPYPGEGDLYRVFVEEYRRRYPEVTVMMICGHNPQRLLTDQRSSLRKFTDGVTLGEPYMPDDEINLMRKREPTFAKGGIVRLSGGRLSFPAILPRGEAVITNPPWDPFEPARLKRHMTEVPKFTATIKIAAEGMERFSASLRQVQQQMQSYQDRVMLMAIYAGYKAEPMFVREHRIAKLLLSQDPRQRKRGNRLFHQWRKTRPGINFTRYRKD